ncbi:MAG: acetolactate synthase large subunit [Pseudomonadales bacterium]
MNGAESLIKTLVSNGVEVCFSNPGTSEMHFVAALDEVEGMRCVLALFEGVASGAADGYARMAGKPAATLLHLGPGLGNAWANIHNASKGNVPMINIIGDHASYHLQYDAPLTSDLHGLAASISDTVIASQSSAEIAHDAADALAAVADNKVASLILPADVSWSDNPSPLPPTVPTPTPAKIDSDKIQRAAELLKNSKTGMLFVGGQVSVELGHELSRISQVTGCRICLETFPTRVSRGAGSAKMEKLPYLAEMAIDHIKEVDALILIGAPAPVSFFAYPNVPSVIQSDTCTVLELCSAGTDVLTNTKALVNALNAEAAEPALNTEQLPQLPSGDLDAMTLAQSLAALIPENAIVVDEGATTGLACYPFTEQAKPHDWLSLTGGSIGFGLPCAVGAAIACPDRKVICLEGDGSAMYTIQALWTMVREQLDVTVVICNNSKYNILELEFARTGARGGVPGDKAASMMDISNPSMDFAEMARGFGMQASRATTAEEFSSQLAHALESTGPTLIDAVVPCMKLG